MTESNFESAIDPERLQIRTDIEVVDDGYEHAIKINLTSAADDAVLGIALDIDDLEGALASLSILLVAAPQVIDAAIDYINQEES